MKIARETCQASCWLVIDRMMRCGKQWHYGLSGRDKAVSRNCTATKDYTGGYFQGRGKRAKDGLGRVCLPE